MPGWGDAIMSHEVVFYGLFRRSGVVLSALVFTGDPDCIEHSSAYCIFYKY